MITISHDYILATEMQLIYNNAGGFEPVQGNLRHWKGQVGTVQGTSIPIYAEIKIQPNFPHSPPVVNIQPKVTHPNINEYDVLKMRILSNWDPRTHVYEVINEIKSLFLKVPAKPLKFKLKNSPYKEPSKLPRIEQSKEIPQGLKARNKEVLFEQEVKTDPQVTRIKKEIQTYQTRIEQINKEIEKERETLLENAGVEVNKDQEREASLNDLYQADVNATSDLIEILGEKFEDGDLSDVDYLKLHRKYTARVFKTKKQLQVIENAGDKMDSRDERRLDLEADLFAAIVTLEKITKGYQQHEIEQIAYKKQLRALIKNIFKSRMRLEQIGGFKLDEFIEREQMDQKYSLGVRQLRVAEGVETPDSISTVALPFDSLKRMPRQTADFVSSAIELIDLTRLKSVARADLILADLDELIHITETFPSIPDDFWIINDMKDWRKIVSNYDTQEVLKEQDCEKLEFQTSRWLNEFRRVLKDL